MIFFLYHSRTLNHKEAVLGIRVIAPGKDNKTLTPGRRTSLLCFGRGGDFLFKNGIQVTDQARHKLACSVTEES